MNFTKLITWLGHSTSKPSAPLIEQMEGRVLMSAGAIAVDPSNPNITDGTSNTVMTARKAGKGQQEYLQIKLENVQITSYQLG